MGWIGWTIVAAVGLPSVWFRPGGRGGGTRPLPGSKR